MKQKQPPNGATSTKVPKRKAEASPPAADTEDTAKEPPSGQKRKNPPSKASHPATKTPRRGSRASGRSTTAPTHRQLLHFLLSDAALRLCYPADEVDAADDHLVKTYSRTSPAAYSPFEHLLIASLLSKPLSHKLGMRSIRTLLNPPFSLDSTRAVLEAGEARVWEALEVARTQHRQKTAGYMSGMAEFFADDPELRMVREKGDPMREVQRAKGVGKTGAELFARRVQCLEDWGKVFPFVDSRGLDALRELGFEVGDADGLKTLIEAEVGFEGVGEMAVSGAEGLEGEQKTRVAFVLVLERAIGASLEGNIQDVKKVAAAYEV